MTSPRSSGLGARLFLAQTLVAVVGAVTLWLVAAGLGSALFFRALGRKGQAVPGDATAGVVSAFQSASAVSTSVALLVALGAALAVSAYVSRRITGHLVELSEAARAVAGGRYDSRVSEPGLGSEFAELADAFNTMAGQIEATETTRRRLLADLGHELRTPVATLHAYLEGVEDGVVVLDPSTVSTMRAQTARLARLTEDIRAVSRAEEHRMDLHWRLVPVGALVSSAIQSAGGRFEAKGVRLIHHVDGGLPALAGDPDLLAQAIGNLLDNALRHAARGGTVSLHARLAAQARPAVELVLTDDGDGIAAEHLPHVFERFYRVDTARDRDHGGSGIGLAIVKALVESHGGTVEVRSAGVGHGATFTVRLPAPSARSLASSVVVGRDRVGLVGQA